MTTVDQQTIQQLLNQITEATNKLNAIFTQETIPKSLQPNTNFNKPQPQPQLNGELSFNPDICAWMPATGRKGEYEVAKDGTNYRFLKAYLEAHEGKATIKGNFYWLFTDKISIGRKPSKNGNGGN